MIDKSAVIPTAPEFTVLPLVKADPTELEQLLDEEVLAWKHSLGWDYARTARLVRDYAVGGLISGVALRSSDRLVGYGYYMLREQLGSIGGIFASPSLENASLASARIFSTMVRQLISDPACRRIEGQLFTLVHSWLEILEGEGVARRQRFYMARQLHDGATAPPGLQPWDNRFLEPAARLLFFTYQCHLDAEISSMYRTVSGCDEFLRNLVLVPGCGELLDGASALFLDSRGEIGGFVLVTRIGPRSALIPQICVRRDLQGTGVGRKLLEHACFRLGRSGFHRLYLCVTATNRQARDLYTRHRFLDVQSFSAFFWDR